MSDNFDLVAIYAPNVERQLKALEALLALPPLDASAPGDGPATQDEEKRIEEPAP